MDQLQIISQLDHLCGTCVSLCNLSHAERLEIKEYIDIVEPNFFNVFNHMPSTENLIESTKEFLIRLWESLVDFIRKAIDFTKSLFGGASTKKWESTKTDLKKAGETLDKSVRNADSNIKESLFDYERGFTGGEPIQEHIRSLISNVYVINDFIERFKYLNIIANGLSAAFSYVDNHIKINPANPTAGLDQAEQVQAVYNLLTDHGKNESVFRLYGIHFNQSATVNMIEIHSINKSSAPVIKAFPDLQKLVQDYIKNGDMLQTTAKQICDETTTVMEKSHAYIMGNNPKSLPPNISVNIMTLVKLKFKLMSLVNSGANTINKDVMKTLNLFNVSSRRLEALSEYLTNNLNKDPRK